jgi:hypothetical protein
VAIRDCFAFSRHLGTAACICVARTRERWNELETLILPSDLAGRWRSVLTGRVSELARVGEKVTILASDLVERGHPCDVLLRTDG